MRKASREKCRGALCLRQVRALEGARRPVWPFSSRSGLPELRGLAAGRRRHAWQRPQVRRASLANLRALARPELKPGQREVTLGFGVLFPKREKRRAKQTNG